MRCAVIGDPVSHSLSPVLHRAAYDALGLAWTYDAVQVPLGGLASFVGGLADSPGEEWRGLSVTAPLKPEAAAYATSVSRVVALSGVANTLVRSDSGGWAADNTDVPGAVAAVRERYAGPVTAATILGGGSTAVSTGLAMADLGASTIRLLVRDPVRASVAAAAIGRHPSGPAVVVASLHAEPVVGEVLVSTIPAAAQTTDLVERCAAVPVVFEVTYHPWPSPLAASVTPDQFLVTGLDLLLHQATLQLELFTGTPAADALASMREAARSAVPDLRSAD
jgi:shikimate dehydrogenase